MGDERQRIRRELQRIALGESDLSGRSLASRVTALRTLERIARDEGDSGPQEPPQERLDYPVNPSGKFEPNFEDPRWWAVDMAWRWTAGSPREAAAVERWQHSPERARWGAAGRPWSRSAWEVDRSPWESALAEQG